jgi:hypothetical protein
MSVATSDLLFWWGISKTKFETSQSTLTFAVVAIICAEFPRNKIKILKIPKFTQN